MNNRITPECCSKPSNLCAPCTICGMNNHITPECRTKQSEFANHSDRPFIWSESHKRLVNHFGKRDMIPKFSELQELRRLHSEPSSSSSSTYAPKKPYAKKDWKNKGTVMTTILPDELPIPTSPNLISVFLTFLLLNHGLLHPMTRIFSLSYTSQVMRIYNLDYVLSVQNLLIYLVMTFLRILLIYHHSI